MDDGEMTWSDEPAGEDASPDDVSHESVALAGEATPELTSALDASSAAVEDVALDDQS